MPARGASRLATTERIGRALQADERTLKLGRLLSRKYGGNDPN
jgi:hypothetical protein